MFSRRIETIEFVNPQTGTAYVDAYDTPTPRRTRHVYHGLEVVQEYHCCDGEAGACGTGIPSCGDNWQLAREFVFTLDTPRGGAAFEREAFAASQGWGDSQRPALDGAQLSQRFPEPIAMVDYTDPSPACEQGGSGCTYHYLRDVLGSITGLTNSSGTLVERYTNDPYGKTLIETRDPLTGDFEAKNASAFGNPWMWTLDARLRQKEPVAPRGIAISCG